MRKKKLNGKILLIAKSIASNDQQERLKLSSYITDRDEDEEKVCEILQREDFCFSDFWKEISPDWGKFACDLYIRIIREEYHGKKPKR